MSDPPTRPSVVPPKAKKLPFKPTALRRPAPKTASPASSDKAQDGDGLDLFRRSKEMRPIVEADRERRLLKKRRRREEEEERRRRAEATAGKRRLVVDSDEERALDADGIAGASPPDTLRRANGGAVRSTTPDNVEGGGFGGEASELVTPPASKRTRLGSSPAKNMLGFGSSGPAAVTHSSSSLVSRMTASAVALESPRRRRGSAKPPRPTPGPVVLSSDSEDDGHAPSPTPRKSGHGHAPAPTPSKNGDERAPTPTPRENDGDDVALLGSSLAATDEDDEFADYIRKAEEQRQQALSEASRQQNAAQETIHILVTSSVPDTKACKMKFVYNKPLRVVKNTWLALQKQKGILTDVEDHDEIVLTWRRKKVYASSTLLNLGIRPEGNGRAVVKGSSTRGLGENRTQVHMEVWTKALFEEMERDEEIQRRREAGELSDDYESGPAEETPAAEVKLRVILKARGLPDVKLTVRPETTVETLLTGFRTQQPGVGGKDVGVWFDGDRLEEHMTMDEVEIDDMDTLEVHIK